MKKLANSHIWICCLKFSSKIYDKIEKVKILFHSCARFLSLLEF